MDFQGKLGNVIHSLLQAEGNADFEPYSYDEYGNSVSAGWPNINIAQSENQKRMLVKFWIEDATAVDYYVFDFGDGAEEKTGEKECVHCYDLSRKDEYLVNSGVIPITGMEQYTGRWANVNLTRVLPDGTSSTISKGFIYELDSVIDSFYWQCIIPDPYTETYQCTVETGTEVQAVPDPMY